MTPGKTIALTRWTFVGKLISLLFNMLSRLVIAFFLRSKSYFNFMAAVTICSDFGAQENKISHCFHCFPIYLPWSDGNRCHDLSFLNVEFTFIKRLFSSSLSAIRVVLSAYLRLMIFLPAILIPACASSNLAFLMMYCAAAAAAKLPQSCLTLCDPIDGSPPGSPVPGILQARTLEWVAISFSNAWTWKMKVKSLSRVRLSVLMDCSLPGSSIHGIFQGRVLEWGAIAFSRCTLHVTEYVTIYSLDILLSHFETSLLLYVQFWLLLLYLHTDFSRGRSGGLVYPSLEEFSTVCCDPHSQRFSCSQ